jgi:hypothetical protein
LFLYETGYGGLIIIGLLLFSALWKTFRQYWILPRSQKYLSAIFFIVLFVFYFLLLSVAGYNWGQQGFMAWIIISLSVAYPRLVRRDLRAKTLPRAEIKPVFQLQPTVMA